MYEIPPKRKVAPRGSVNRRDVEEAAARAVFVEELVQAVESDPRVRAAILRLVAGTRRAPGPTTMATVRRGGGG
ncbi:hypothetical protein CTZ27_33325 [Streptomyces griseocarneus]|nr:hypothetical protein CTZ27_33325 [Streptomyces griseocarneus]